MLEHRLFPSMLCPEPTVLCWWVPVAQIILTTLSGESTKHIPHLGQDLLQFQFH